MIFDRTTLFSYARRAPFGNRLTPEQVSGMESLVSYWEVAYAHRDIRLLAYILATVFHETGGRMVPVREGFAKSDEEARRIVAGRSYGKPDPETGHVYYGRGHVQLTWKENYKRMGDLINVDLVSDPDKALNPNTSTAILFEGMLRGVSAKGDFTGKALEDYFNETTEDPQGARKVVNGHDKKALIASYYRAFKDALIEARMAPVMGTPEDASEDKAKPDGPNLLADKTVIGAITTGVGGAAGSIVGAVTNPWALGAFLVIVVGLYLVLTGRIEIKTKAGA